MAEVRWTSQGAEDLESIIDFIARDSQQYARLFALDVFQAFERIASFPESGRVVPEVNDPAIREVILGNYRLVYRFKGGFIDVLTIYHGARLLDPERLGD